MRLYMCSIFDRRAEEYSPPMCQHTLGTAERTFHDITNNPESPVNKHPEDYQLHHVGYFDTDTGEITTEKELPRLIIHASELVALKQ